MGSFSILNWASLKFIDSLRMISFGATPYFCIYDVVLYIYPQSKQGCGVDFGARVGYRQGC